MIKAGPSRLGAANGSRLRRMAGSAILVPDRIGLGSTLSAMLSLRDLESNHVVWVQKKLSQKSPLQSAPLKASFPGLVTGYETSKKTTEGSIDANSGLAKLLATSRSPRLGCGPRSAFGRGRVPFGSRISPPGPDRSRMRVDPRRRPAGGANRMQREKNR